MRFHRAGMTFLEILIIVGLIALIAATAIPLYTKARGLRQKKACIENLERIEDAKKFVAEELGLSENEELDAAAVGEHLNESGGLPECPSGGSYTFGGLDADPDCSELGHSLP